MYFPPESFSSLGLPATSRFLHIERCADPIFPSVTEEAPTPIPLAEGSLLALPEEECEEIAATNDLLMGAIPQEDLQPETLLKKRLTLLVSKTLLEPREILPIAPRGSTERPHLLLVVRDGDHCLPRLISHCHMPRSHELNLEAGGLNPTHLPLRGLGKKIVDRHTGSQRSPYFERQPAGSATTFPIGVKHGTKPFSK
jgi:hypothetical protein